MSDVKNATLRAIVNGVLTELMVKTTATQVYLPDNKNVAQEIIELALAINKRAKIDDVNKQISDLRQELLGDTPVEAYNTFTELAAYIQEHEEISDALVAAIGSKADKAVVDEILATVSTLGAISTKDIITENELDSTLKEKVNTAADGNHTHSNKRTLDEITDNQVASWDGKTKLLINATKPEGITSSDLWFHIN